MPALDPPGEGAVFLESIMLRRYRFEIIFLMLILCALIATRFFFS